MNLFAAEYQPTAAAVLHLASISNNPNFLLVKVSTVLGPYSLLPL